MTLRSPSLVRLMGEPKALISHEDAEKLGVKSGDWVEIETKRGKIRMKAEVGKVPSGLVVVPSHFKVNRLPSPALNKAGTPEFKFAAARVRKA
jgi:anaerobic selenocysteine-containing dehydrogenase